MIGVGPVIGSAILAYLLYESVLDLAKPSASYSGTSVFGIGVPLGIGVLFSVLGIVFMLIWRFGRGRDFFHRHGFESVPHEIALGPTAPGS